MNANLDAGPGIIKFTTRHRKAGLQPSFFGRVYRIRAGVEPLGEDVPLVGIGQRLRLYGS